MDLLERIVQIAGGLAVVVMILVVLAGLRAAGKHKVEREVGRKTAFIRSGWFIVLSIVLAIAVFWLLWRPLPLQFSDPFRLVLLIVGTLLYFPGIALILWGRRTLAEMYNVSSSFGVQIFEGHRLVTSGPYHYVRHPMYLGTILWVLGALFLYRNWAMLILMTFVVSMYLRSKKEEQALIETFGDEYREYMRRTPAFFPGLKSR
ncbi:MAG TPA: isoprenylcysteine carboxylmethyltransferase family protein [Anaerolineaceae bacterium]|nr:isoprenylcysteine carboxylmethyltransferase family protein [Anaerolineaceae bacterium]